MSIIPAGFGGWLIRIGWLRPFCLETFLDVSFIGVDKSRRYQQINRMQRDGNIRQRCL